MFYLYPVCCPKCQEGLLWVYHRPATFSALQIKKNHVSLSIFHFSLTSTTPDRAGILGHGTFSLRRATNWYGLEWTGMGIETIETTVLPVSFGDGSLFVCKPVSSYVVADSLFSSKAPLPNGAAWNGASEAVDPSQVSNLNRSQFNKVRRSGTPQVFAGLAGESGPRGE